MAVHESFTIIVGLKGLRLLSHAAVRTAVRDVFRRLMDGVEPAYIDTAEAALAARPGGAFGA